MNRLKILDLEVSDHDLDLTNTLFNSCKRTLTETKILFFEDLIKRKKKNIY